MNTFVCVSILSAFLVLTFAQEQQQQKANTRVPIPWRSDVPACRDFYDTCVTWKSNGECVNNPTFMDFYCRQSCQKCGVPMSHPDSVMSNPNGPPGFEQLPSILTPGWNDQNRFQKK